MVIIGDYINNKYILPIDFTGKICYKKLPLKYSFYKDDSIHRYYGPVQIWNDGQKDCFFNNKVLGRSNKNYNQKQFTKDISKQWLK